jgi:hypothetical protein
MGQLITRGLFLFSKTWGLILKFRLYSDMSVSFLLYCGKYFYEHRVLRCGRNHLCLGTAFYLKVLNVFHPKYLRKKIYLRPYLKYGFNCAVFLERKIRILYRTSPTTLLI